jgi:hypothetical protein
MLLGLGERVITPELETFGHRLARFMSFAQKRTRRRRWWWW